MNIINRLTLRQLKLNRRRTLVTICGVIISAAMITAVATLGESYLDLMRRQNIADSGEWHVRYDSVDDAQLAAIRADSDTKDVSLSRDLGYAILDGSENRYKPYLFVREYNDAGFAHFPVTLTSGRLPAAPDELVISDAIAPNAKVSLAVGDTLTLAIGDRLSTLPDADTAPLTQSRSLQTTEDGASAETLIPRQTRTYTVVGTIARPEWEHAWAPGYTVLSYAGDASVTAETPANASVIVKKVTPALFDRAEALAQAQNIESVSFNNSLLRFYGITKHDGLRSVLYGLCAILMAIIVVGSVSLIYNAFAISVSERSRYLGMLKSIGATRAQMCRSVFFEGAVIGAASIPLGILAGLAGIGVTFLCINPLLSEALGLSETFRLVVSVPSILCAAAVSALTIFISTLIPAARAARITPIDAIRQSQDIRLRAKSVRTSRLTRAVFGFEAELALKNLKRNRKRYQATVFSLMISILLFLTVSYFTGGLRQALIMTQTDIRYDIMASLRDEAPGAARENAARMQSLDRVRESSVLETYPAALSVAEENASAAVRGALPLEDGAYRYSCDIVALEDSALTAWCDALGVDPEVLLSGDACVVINRMTYEDQAAGRYVEDEVMRVLPGETLTPDAFAPADETNAPLPPLTVAALAEDAPLGISTTVYGPGSATLVVSRRTLGRILAAAPAENASAHTAVYFTSDEPLALQEDLENLNLDGLYIYNVYRERRSQDQMLLLMSVFTYGFIVLISAICAANIFNTISTGIAQRGRELAMLRSVGMAPSGFNRMIRFESLFYGIKALAYGLPLSILVMYLIYRRLGGLFSFRFVPPWGSILLAAALVFALVACTMAYAVSKLKRENIVEALHRETF